MSVLRLTEEQYKAKQAKAGRGIQAVAREAGSTPAAPTKYRNRKTGGYASAKEARRAEQLKLLLHAGEIKNLREQVRYLVIPAQHQAGKLLERECTYVADFVYQEWAKDCGFVHWLPVVEDCKGMKTPDYIIKRKLMLHVHGIRIKET